MAFSDVIKQGSRLGIFSSLPGQTGSLNLESIPGFSSLSVEKQNELREQGIRSQIEAISTAGALAPLIQQPYSLDELGRFREQEARRAQELGKESVREAYKYKTLADIPKTIAQSFGNIAATNLYGGQAIADSLAKTMGQYPRAQFVAHQFQPEKYFG